MADQSRHPGAPDEPRGGRPQGREGLAVSPRDTATGKVEPGKGPSERPGTEAAEARRASDSKRD